MFIMSTTVFIIFDEECFSMKNYFEDVEYRRSILTKLNNLTLKSVVTSNEDKSVEECLQLLIKQLRHLQHDLNSKLRSEEFIHNKLINASQNVFVCQHACFKLSDSPIDLINDLRSSIVIYQKTNSSNLIETFETFFIDRRYHKNCSLRTDNISSRINNFQLRIIQNRRYSTKKKCFVCQKEECWSTKHSKDERETPKQKFKNRFFIRIDHYISEYERTNSSSSHSEEDDYDTDLIDEMKTLIVNLSALSLLSLLSNSNNFSNVETFIISFDLVQNAEMMITNLANRSLSHFLINNLHTCMNDDQTADDLQTSLKIFFFFSLVQTGLKMSHFVDLVHICMKNTITKDIDFFTYIIIDRYIFEVFYDLMIDSDVFTQSTVDYEQFLAYQKNNKNDLIDIIKAEAINVQFEIESIFSLESIIIDISIELVKFHVIKTDTSFLLSLADMNWLKVYFNNVENLLIDTIKVLSIIRRFDHDFLLWKNSYSLDSYIAQSLYSLLFS
jgi:hypothetical protein